jgi:hypothetical protein
LAENTIEDKCHEGIGALEEFLEKDGGYSHIRGGTYEVWYALVL